MRRMYVLISTLNAKLLGFEHIKELYPDDHDFSVEYQACEKTALASTLGMMATYFERINYVRENPWRRVDWAFWNNMLRNTSIGHI